jgi:hypothetical protein
MHWEGSSDHDPTPRFFEQDLVGTEFMTGMFQEFFRRTKFDIDHVYDLQSALCRGPFGHHLYVQTPAFIRALSITLAFVTHPDEKK